MPRTVNARPFRAPLLLLLLMLFPVATLFPCDAFADSRAGVAEAVKLYRQGKRAEALAKYEALLDADRGALAVPHGGLLPALVEAWRARAATGGPEENLRLAYLLDISGRVEEAKAIYARLAREAPKAFARRAEDNLAMLTRERETYDAYLAQMRREAAEERRARDRQLESALAAETREQEARVALEAFAAAEAAKSGTERELAAGIERAADALVSAEREVWRAKRDWYGFEGARKWRATPGEPERSYDGTLRRRYRQAVATRDAAAASLAEAQARLESFRAAQAPPAE